MRPRDHARRGKALLAMAITTWIAFLITAAPAFAHDRLIGSNPVDGSTIDALPHVVTLYFEEPPGTGFSSLKVLSPTARNIDSAMPSINGSQISVPVSHATQSGVYTIQFNIISDDGHPVGGVLHFTLSAGSRAVSSNTAVADAQTTAATPGSSVSLGWTALAVVAITATTLARLAMKSARSRVSSAR